MLIFCRFEENCSEGFDTPSESAILPIIKIFYTMQLSPLKSLRTAMMATVVMASFFVTACGSAEEKPAETSTEMAAPAPDTTAPAATPDTTARDTASTRPVVTPNK
jgi:hypothetical protein